MKCLFPSILHLVFLIFLLFQSSRSFNLIDHCCKEAANNNPNLSYDFCLASLEANPKSQNATIEELVAISIDLAISNATNIISHISRLLGEKDFDAYAIAALHDCLELYLNANSTLHDAMTDLKSKDYFTANIHVSAAMDSGSTCEDGFKEKEGEVCPVTKKNDMFMELTSMILAFMKNFTL